MMGDRGVIFVAIGDLYVKNAIRAAASVRKWEPYLPIHLFTDELGAATITSAQTAFTSHSLISDPHRRSKIECMGNSPFEQTLYLDTDTKVAAEIGHIFTVLEKFDFALCHEHRRSAEKMAIRWKKSLPNAFPQFNSGVVLFRKNALTTAFFDCWAENYRAAGIKQDQVTLRELLWTSDVKLFILPPEYNIRYLKYKLLWSPLEVIPRIYHLRHFHLGFWLRIWDPFRLLKNFLKYYFENRFGKIKK